MEVSTATFRNLANLVNDIENEGNEVTGYEVEVNLEAKLKELLHKINSSEIKLCLEAAKEFRKLLQSDSGGELLRLYLQSSSKCSELLDAWKLWQGKPGMPYIFSLVSEILCHPDGKENLNDLKRISSIRKVLDNFARLLFEEYLEDIYKELSGQEVRRQNAALSLLASIIRRGSDLACEVEKKFDFKLKAFSKLAEYKRKQNKKRSKHSSRKLFVEFAMSFLEVGKPRWLSRVVQRKEMYSGVLRALENDEEETVVYVLSTLKDKVISKESLVPPSLRSVLFGRVTLEQLVIISGRENGGIAADLAHTVLGMVCTDSSNGLMPDLKRQPDPLKGNPERILGLMKKLKATEIDYHRDLLLAIVRGKPFFCSAYLEEFPYNLEDHASPSWFLTASLAANLVSSVNTGYSFGFFDSHLQDLPSFANEEVQSIMKCISPRPFSRSIINKGLLHSNFLVKHATLRLLLEVLKFLDSFIAALDQVSTLNKKKMPSLHFFKQEIQDKVWTSLPDSQVLLSLLSPLGSQSRSLKRTTDLECSNNSVKKLKTLAMDMDTDIVVSGISYVSDIPSMSNRERVIDSPTEDESDREKDLMTAIAEIWGLESPDLSSVPLAEMMDSEIFFHSKLLDALKFYLRTMPTALEGSFEFFMNILSNSLALPTTLQCSLLSLLVDFIGRSPESAVPIRLPPGLYKHLQQSIDLLMFSPITDIRDQAYHLTQAAMLSTGAFDRNVYEIGAWLLFLPGYDPGASSVELGMKNLQNLARPVILFLCDAISTVGNSLFKYWGMVKNYTCHLKGFKDVSPSFSPLVICVLQKCIRLLSSESGTFTLPEKTMISLYVCNTLKYLLQTQVDAGLLSSVIKSVFSERLEDFSFLDKNSEDFFCEWKPLKNLLLFSRRISGKETFCISCNDKKTMPGDTSLTSTLGEVQRLARSRDGDERDGLAKAFVSSVICATSDGILNNFPLIMNIFKDLRVPISFFSCMFFSEENLLTSVSSLWPAIYLPSLKMAFATTNNAGAHGAPDHASSTKEIIRKCDYDAKTGFSLFLKQVPFHVIFPAIMRIDGPCSSERMVIQDLLLLKLSEMTTDHHLISYLRFVLFWAHQILSSYRIEPIVELQQLSHICFVLVKSLLAKLLSSRTGSGPPLSSLDIQAANETIFSHPAVATSLTCPISCYEGLCNDDVEDSLDGLIRLSRHRIHKLDDYILDLLGTISAYLLSLCKCQDYVSKDGDCLNKQLVKAFNILIQRLFQEFRLRFDLYIDVKDLTTLLPVFFALHSLTSYISPFALLELVHWMFERINTLTVEKPLRPSGLSLGLCIAAMAFKNFSNYMQQPVQERKAYNLFWEKEEKNIDVNIMEELYLKLCTFAMLCESELADMCLLEAVNFAYKHKSLHCGAYGQIRVALSRLIAISPMKLLHYCIYRTSKTKARLLFALTEISSLHLSISGYIIFGILNKRSYRGKPMENTFDLSLSAKELVMLLPTALSYLDSTTTKFQKKHWDHHSKSVPSSYLRTLFKGFDWKCFVSGDIFQEEYRELLPPSSIDELLGIVNSSVLGKTIKMLRHQFAVNGDSVKAKKRVSLFNSMFPCSDGDDKLLDADAEENDSYSLDQWLNYLNKVVAKISFGMMLLFPKDNRTQSQSEEADENLDEGSKEMGSIMQESKMRFLNILASAWQRIVKKFPLVSYSPENQKSSDMLSPIRYLDVFILEAVLELTTEMRHTLIQSHSIPFLEQLVRCSFLYRFEDPTTLKIVRGVLTLLYEGKFARTLYPQLLHSLYSQFVATIHLVAKSSTSSPIGSFPRPMSSILRSLVPSTNQGVSDKHNPEKTQMCEKQLEILRILQLLLRLTADQCGKEFGINLKELHLLLLSSYGATLSEIDVVIYSLMNEIESIDGSVFESLAEVDFLWGNAALRNKKENATEQDFSCEITDDAAVLKYRYRNQFREHLPIEPKRCVSTVLYFPHDYRSAYWESLPLTKVQLKDIFETHFDGVKHVQRYDPVFILRFTMHSLSMGYIEPAEFASLGLLAIAIISLSSADDSLRKLAYETLMKFEDVLKNCQDRSHIKRLLLLLTFVKNGITEPCQRIPSVLALFAAETSFILLDPSYNHYGTLSKILTDSTKRNSSGMNMKSIPLFHNFFWSMSSNFKAEKLWILRLVYAGINVDEDAHIYIRNSIPEALLELYNSPLSDNEAKELILQMVKKCVKLQKMARYLLQHCGLLLWLSLVLSTSFRGICGNDGAFILNQKTVVLEIINDVLSSKDSIEWLKDYALEQLMEISSHIFIFINSNQVIKEEVSLLSSMLQTLISTLKISQKRKVLQPHFTLSIEGLFNIYGAIKAFNNGKSSSISLLGLKVILMSTPPPGLLRMDEETLSNFVFWAISSALESDSTIIHMSEEEQCKESLMSKLLHWLTASVIQEKLSMNMKGLDPNLSTLLSLVEYVQGSGNRSQHRNGSEEFLAATIFYLNQCLKIDRVGIQSVIAALTLLLSESLSSAGASQSDQTLAASLLSKIHSPAEAKPGWRWSCEKAWDDSLTEPIDVQKMDELHACETLVIIISNVLVKKTSNLQILRPQQVQQSGVFEWERSLIETDMK